MSGEPARIRRVASIPSTPGHPHVHQHDVRTQQLGLANRLLAAHGLSGDLEALDAVDQGAQAGTDDRVVVGDQYP